MDEQIEIALHAIHCCAHTWHIRPIMKSVPCLVSLAQKSGSMRLPSTEIAGAT